MSSLTFQNPHFLVLLTVFVPNRRHGDVRMHKPQISDHIHRLFYLKRPTAGANDENEEKKKRGKIKRTFNLEKNLTNISIYWDIYWELMTNFLAQNGQTTSSMFIRGPQRHFVPVKWNKSQTCVKRYTSRLRLGLETFLNVLEEKKRPIK